MIAETVAKNEDLRELIIKISENEINHNDIIQELKIIFTQDYKCDYSYIVTVLFELNEGATDFIKEPLEKAYIELSDDLGGDFEDFYSAISLEMRRINFTKQLDNKAESLKMELNNIKIDMDEQSVLMKAINEELKSKKEQLASINNNHLSILGIFSGIVMVFFGGLSIASETMKFADISIMRLVLIICLVGFIIFNSIFVLIYLISKLTSSDSDLKVKCDKCTDQVALTCYSCDKNYLTNICKGIKLCNPVNKIKNLYPVVFYINLCFLCFIAIDFIVWLFLKSYLELFFVFIGFAFVSIIMFFTNG